jgi:hypothetical protein
MENYRDWDNDSGIESYEIGDDYIVVKFKSGRNRFYKYTYRSARPDDIEEMKKMAHVGDGLNEFIVEEKVNYESKW